MTAGNLNQLFTFLDYSTPTPGTASLVWIYSQPKSNFRPLSLGLIGIWGLDLGLGQVR